jgi:malate dehydrogenase
VLADQNPYGIPAGLIYSYPLTTDGKTWKILSGLAIDEDARKRLDASAAELKSEREAVKDLMGPAV